MKQKIGGHKMNSISYCQEICNNGSGNLKQILLKVVFKSQVKGTVQ